MGPHALRPLSAVCTLLLAAPLLCGHPLRAQVFVVGERSATADVTTTFRPTHVDLPGDPLDDLGHMEIIRNLMSEQGFAHRELPLGAGLTLIANGNMSPRDEEYKRMLYEKGQSASAGERIEVSALKFGSDRIIIDFNGGPYAKHRFISHISVNDIQLAQQGPLATGCRVTLVFEGGKLPDVTAAQIKELLDPIVDFKAHSEGEAYSNTLPAKVREAVQSHQILVGMDRRMVLAAVGEPHDKHREHVAAENEASPVYEEWIYGVTPEAIRFVRFRNGRVVRLEIAALGKPLEIRDHNEIDGDDSPVLFTRRILNGDRVPNPDVAAPPPPSLKRDGEVLDSRYNRDTAGKVIMPPDPAKPLPKDPTPQ